MLFTTTAIMPFSERTTPFRLTWPGVRQRLPVVQPVFSMCVTTGLTKGSRRATANFLLTSPMLAGRSAPLLSSFLPASSAGAGVVSPLAAVSGLVSGFGAGALAASTAFFAGFLAVTGFTGALGGVTAPLPCAGGVAACTGAPPGLAGGFTFFCAFLGR